MSTKHLLRSFAGGEITPELAGRLDLVKYQTGLSLARNFITLPHGPAVRRPGFEFVREAGNSVHKVRLIPFTFSASQTAVVELGHGYIRFHIDGATLLDPGTGLPYQISSPYASDDLFDLHYAQSADVITITHPGYATRELARQSSTSWTLSSVSFAPPAAVPTGVTATPTVAQNQNLTQTKYVVTAVRDDGVTESLPSTPATAMNNLTLAGNFNTITWAGVDGYSRYNVYKLRGGVYGYIGQVVPSGSTPKSIATAVGYDVKSWFVTKRVRVTTTTGHGYSTGDRVYVQGTTHFDGLFQITVESGTVFTYAKEAILASVNAGTVSSPSLALVDDNVQADTTQSPPENIIGLNAGANDYPAATVYHEQRRWFAGTNAKPQVMWATRTGTDTNLTSSLPSREADGMELRVASSQYNQIRHLVALSDLIALTAGGEFRIYADGAPAITPTTVSVKPQGYAGASNTQPVVTTGSVLYVQAQGSRIRELSYSWEASAYRTMDASIMSPHRFNGYTITDLAYSRAPESILWAVRSDGTLLGMTYVPDQQVYGWHAHDTDGTFESVTVVPEANEDVLYVVVRRTIGGSQLRYIERLSTRIFTEQEDAFFVDSGLTYSGSPATTISGLSHLNGKEVDILADGAVHPRRTVSGGAITLDYAASKVHIGLPITADLRTLPLAVEGAQAAGQGTVKNVNRVHLRVSQSSIVKAGPSFDRLREYPARAITDPYGAPPALRDGELSLSVDPSWNSDAAICVRQDLPLPLNVLSMTLEVQSGG
jgi:hypothetical protein